MRHCPLLELEIGCTNEKPWCGYCRVQAEVKATLGVVTPQPTPLNPPARQRPRQKRRPCIDCRQFYTPQSPRQLRCPDCALKHNRGQNVVHQNAWRARRKLRKQIAAKRRHPSR
jgi:hypothetical protein